jgi:hypothetical protein
MLLILCPVPLIMFPNSNLGAGYLARHFGDEGEARCSPECRQPVKLCQQHFEKSNYNLTINISQVVTDLAPQPPCS